MKHMEMPYVVYILDGHIPVPTDNITEWGEWFNGTDRHVATTTLESGVFVSTVFLGVDHSWVENGPPILFETMVFDPRKPRLDQWLEDYTRRYATWEEAEAGHKEVVEEVLVAEGRSNETKTE